MKKSGNDVSMKRKGFTLIELVIVMAILGLLMAIAVPRFTEYQRTAQKAVVDANAKQITTAAMAYSISSDAGPTSITYDNSSLAGYVENVNGVSIITNTNNTYDTVAELVSQVTGDGQYATGYITTEWKDPNNNTHNNAYVTVAYDPYPTVATKKARVYVGGVYAGNQ